MKFIREYFRRRYFRDLRKKFADFSMFNSANNYPREDRFRWFWKLELWGEDRVRQWVRSYEGASARMKEPQR